MSSRIWRPTRAIRVVDGLRLHGLVQTEGYIRAMLSAGSMDQRARERFARVRLKRQEILTRPDPPRLWLLLGEAALRQRVGGPEVMRAQLRRLVELSELDHVTIRAVPFDAGAHLGLDGSFVHMEVGRRHELTVVLVESLTRGWYLEEREDIRRHTEAFDRIAGVALSEDDSRALVERISSDL